MEKLIIGSTALKHWYSEARNPKDLDLISSKPKMLKETQHYWVDSFREILRLNKDPDYIDPHLLLTLKASHAGWDIHWEKTMHDILFLKARGHKINVDLYWKLVKDWKKVHGKSWATLKDKGVEDFFNDAVKRKYIHDDIHLAVAVHDEPLYFRILKSPDSVACSENKFNRLSHEDKINLVKEETWVTALERYLIPADFKFNYKIAYSRSLKKLITTMSSGWFKLWMIDNYQDIYQPGNKNFIDKFNLALKQNKIREHGKEA